MRDAGGKVASNAGVLRHFLVRLGGQGRGGVNPSHETFRRSFNSCACLACRSAFGRPRQGVGANLRKGARASGVGVAFPKGLFACAWARTERPARWHWKRRRADWHGPLAGHGRLRFFNAFDGA